VTDTTSDRLHLATLVRELEKQLKENIDAVFKAWVPHQDQAGYYFRSYFDYLKLAIQYPELPFKEIFQHRWNAPLVVHRDNLGSLAGQIGELASALESSVKNTEKQTSITTPKTPIMTLKTSEIIELLGLAIGLSGSGITSIWFGSQSADLLRMILVLIGFILIISGLWVPMLLAKRFKKESNR